jgi:hypothetical protein
VSTQHPQTTDPEGRLVIDSLPGRERFYRQHIEPNRWLRVVVDFNDEPGWIVTAVVQENDPEGAVK